MPPVPGFYLLCLPLARGSGYVCSAGHGWLAGLHYAEVQETRLTNGIGGRQNVVDGKWLATGDLDDGFCPSQVQHNQQRCVRHC